MEKILSIGLSSFSSRDVEICFSVNDLPSLFDYDIVIVDPLCIISEKYNYTPWKTIKVDRSDGVDYAEILKRMKKESAILLQKGGTIICLVTPQIGTQFVTTAVYTRDNYDWLPINYENRPIGDIIERGKGKGLKDIKKSVFEKYINNNSEWHGYFGNSGNFTSDNEVLDEFELKKVKKFEHEVLAKNDGGKPIAISVKSGNGQIVFLPLSNHEKMADILLQCAIKSKSKITEKEPPDWLQNYQVPDEENLRESIKTVGAELENIQEKKNNLQTEFDAKTNVKKLLYEQSDALEDVVKSTFEELGISMAKKGSKDWIAKINQQDVIIEVTGQIGSIDVTKLSQIIRYKLEEEEESKEQKCAILVVNHFADDIPEKRGDAFTDETVKRANALSIGLLSTTELYNAINKMRSGETSKKEICEKLLCKSGIIELI